MIIEVINTILLLIILDFVIVIHKNMKKWMVLNGFVGDDE